MAALEPFEPAPHVAVAVSGGADSLALCLLVHAWALARGGRVTALTVDHRLRADSTAEAAQVGCWLRKHGIEHRILIWSEAKPATGIQEAARQARYRLLVAACREACVLHLLLAHHAVDQTETMLLRLLRGSGVFGLAAMQPVIVTPHCRILRPLLGIQPGSLRQYLSARGQPWVEDATNRSSTFARVRVRRALPSLAANGLDGGEFGRIHATMQHARAMTDAATVAWLASGVTCHAAGYAEVDLSCLGDAPTFLAVRVLGRLIMAVGGGCWEPDEAAVHRLRQRCLAAAPGMVATLGRCRLQRRTHSLLVCRERRNLPLPQLVLPQLMSSQLMSTADVVHWDGRFAIRIVTTAAAPPASLHLQALAAIPVDERAVPNPSAVPKVVWPTLPALVDTHGLAQIPHLGYRREGQDADIHVNAAFLPRRCLDDANSIIV